MKLGLSVLLSLGGISSHLCCAATGINILSPAPNASVLGLTAVLEVADCGVRPESRVELDGLPREIVWTRSSMGGPWYGALDTQAYGDHRLKIEGHCSYWGTSDEVRFKTIVHGTPALAEEVASNYMVAHPASTLAWDWGPSVFLDSLSPLQKVSNLGSRSHPYLDYLRRYHAGWNTRGVPVPDRSDLCAPALSALTLLEENEDASGIPGILKTSHYLKTEPRNPLGALNHLGNSFLSYFYPQSIWVDSLMMYGVFSVKWALFSHDSTLFDFGVSQVPIFASVLQDSETGLFRHAWKTGSKKPIPQSQAFWLRGNAWVLVASAQILDLLENAGPAHAAERESILQIYTRLAKGLLPYQLPNGMWDTVINLPGYSYSESSGTLLAAYAIAHGVHRGWLDPSFLPVAKRAFAGVTATLEATEYGLSLPRVSGSTNPGTAFYYKLIGQHHDLPYGVGGYVLAATELKDETF